MLFPAFLFQLSVSWLALLNYNVSFSEMMSSVVERIKICEMMSSLVERITI